MEKLFLFALLSWVTGQPLVALLAVLLLSGAGYGYLSGRLFRIPRAYWRWGAIRELRRLLVANPHDASARNDLGRLLVESRRYAAALPHLEAALARMPDAPETLYYLGAARLGAGDTAGRALVEEALRLDPKLRYGEPYLTLGSYHLQRGAPADAIAALRAFTDLNASSVEGRYKLARAWREAGDHGRAREAAEDAVEAYRQSPPFRRREERLWRLRVAWLRSRLR